MNRLAMCCLLLMAVSVPARAGTESSRSGADVTAAARTVFAAHAKSVVNIGGILSVDMGMMGANEQEVNVLGTVLDASGLTVVSNSALNPFGDEPLELEPQPGMVVSISGELTRIWFQLADGERVDAQIVLTDPELDVAIIRPADADGKAIKRLDSIDTDDLAGEAAMFDRVIALGRLSKLTGWAPTAHIRHVSAVLEQPRTCYQAQLEPGTPVFDQDGKLIGVTVMLVDVDNGIDPMALMMGGALGGAGQAVVLPAGEIKALIRQAQEV